MTQTEEAIDVMHRAGIEIRQLRESNAEMLAALRDIRSKLKRADEQDAYGPQIDVPLRAAIKVADAAIRHAKCEHDWRGVDDGRVCATCLKHERGDQ